MKVLVAGGSCLLGKYLALSVPKGVELIRTWYTNQGPGYQMNVCEQSQVQYVVGRVDPDIIIHMAAPGSVDWCERNYLEAQRIIIDGTKNVLKAADGRKVIYTSTNAVFSGKDPPYSEDSERMPINAYGRLRKRAEDLVMEYNSFVILRLFLLYGWEPAGARVNWASALYRKFHDGEQASLVDDRWWQPTYAGSAATAIWKLLDKDREVFHVAGEDRVTLLQFGREVVRTFSLNRSLLRGVPSDGLEVAPRPVDTSYDLSKLYDSGIKPVGIRVGLGHMLREID